MNEPVHQGLICRVGRKVAWWARLLAIFFVLVAAGASCFTIFKLIRDGWPEGVQLFDLVLIAYISTLFGYVAATGRPLVKWFPIAALRLPFKLK